MSNGEIYEKKPGETADALENRVREEIISCGRGGLFVPQLVPVFESSPYEVKIYPAGDDIVRVSAARSKVVEVPRKLGVPETWLVLLREVVPRLTRIAVLSNPRSPEWRPVENAIEIAATRRGMSMVIVTIRWPGEMQTKLEWARRHAQAVVVLPDPMFLELSAPLIASLARLRLPALYGRSDFVKMGGLMSYSPADETSRDVARYIANVLRDPDGADYTQTTDYRLTLNPLAAKAAGLDFPRSIEQHSHVELQ